MDKRSKHEERRRGNGSRAMKMEILYFEGCPNHAPALEMVRRVLDQEKIEAGVRLIEVTDEKVVETVRFLGSPSVRVDRYGDYLFRFAMLRLRDRSTAEDLVQETFLAALKGRRSGSGNLCETTVRPCLPPDPSAGFHLLPPVPDSERPSAL
jgi:hypothetical protein